MTRRLLLFAFLATGLLAVVSPSAPAAQGVASAQSHVYELRIYTANEGKLEALKARFRDHTVALFKKHHLNVIGYWTPSSDDPKSKDTLIYIVAHKSREEAAQNWKAFDTDPEWVKVKAESEKGGPLVKKYDSTFMDATSFSALR